MEPTTPTPLIHPKKPAGHKIFPILGVLIICLIASLFVRLLIKDRIQYADQANTTIQTRWGSDTVAFSPILLMSEKSDFVSKKFIFNKSYLADGYDPEEETSYLNNSRVISPKNITTNVLFEPEKRSYGIFNTLVYNAIITTTGSFAVTPSAKDFLINNSNELIFVSPNSAFTPQQIGKSTLVINNNTEIDTTTASSKTTILASDSYAWINGKLRSTNITLPKNLLTESGEELTFTHTITLKGSRSFAFHAPATDASITLQAPWDKVSLGGALLPETRSLDKDAFTAQWISADYNQDNIISYHEYSDLIYGSISQDVENDNVTIMHTDNVPAEEISSSYTAQVEFMGGAHDYVKTDRATKYALLFITLTFLILFLFEIIKNVRIHPMQYFLVGAGLAIFYLLLLAFSEHIGFFFAYIIASIAIVGISTWYVQGFLADKKQVWIVTGLLAFLYTFMYFLLQLQDYTLLAGTLFVFAILIVTMYMTRSIDWYATLNSQTQK